MSASSSSTSACRSRPRTCPASTSYCPDFEYVRERADQIEAVVLTHGHEDHIGALPYLLRELERHPRLRDGIHARAARGQARGARRGGPRANSHVVTPGEGRRPSGPFTMRFLRVTHSIPDGMAVVVDTRTGASCTRATSRSTRRRWTGGRPTCTVWPKRRAGAASTCSCPTRPTPRRPGTRRANGASGPVLHASSRRPHTSSWWRASPATSTGSSRW